jgi:hypothetical protein
MAFAVADRVKETTTTTGTGTVNLGGALDTFQTFVAGVGGGNTTYYSIFHQTANEWEVGIGTVTDAATDTLSRDTIISSSNGGSAVNFSAGTKDVICTLPSSKSYILDNAGDTTISADLSVTSISGSGAGLTTLNASNLASGTLPDARFPATLPTSSGANLTNLNASNVSSGTIADARLTANVTLNNASTISTGTLPNARLSAVPNSALDNSSITINGSGVSLGGSINVGDIEGVTAGSGLTGGGTTGTVTLNVGAGTGIDVAADSIAVDVSDFMSNGSNNRVLTATGTDAMNAESGLTYDGTTLLVSTSNPVLSVLDDSGSTQTATAKIHGNRTGTGGSVTKLAMINSEGAGVGVETAEGSIQAWYQSAGVVNMRHYIGATEILRVDSAGIDVTGTVLTDKAYIALATLTDGATINWNMSTQSVAKVTLGGNRTMAAPTNGSTGQFASIIVIQDGTGTRTLTWNAVFEFKDDAAPTLTSTGGKGDLFVFQYNGSKWLEVGRNLNLTQS